MTVNVGTISKTLTTDSKGQATVDVSGLVPKTYDATIKFTGDNNYTSSSKSVSVVVKGNTKNNHQRKHSKKQPKPKNTL